MLSCKDIAILKTVIEICNNSDLKKEILYVPESECHVNKVNCTKDNKLQWVGIVMIKTAIILKKLGLPKQLQNEVTSTVFPVGMKILLWTGYHEDTFGLSREYIFNFLKNSFFTFQGVIDNKKAAEELLKDESLNIKEKYKLACLYCFTDHIPVLFRQMTTEEKNDFYNAENFREIEQSEFIKCWSYDLMSDIDKLLSEGENLDQYRLEKAVRSGSKAAVEYCLEKTILKMDAVVDAAMEAVRCIIKAQPHTYRNSGFRNWCYEDGKGSWVPGDYYVNILCFLLSKMAEDLQMEFFKKEIEVSKRRRREEKRNLWSLTGKLIRRNVFSFVTVEYFKFRNCSVVLEHFLNWPYQNYFMKKANLMWEFLPEKDFAIILVMICNLIESKYGERKSFNYRELLKEFWCQSPDRYKRYVFNNRKLKAGVALKIEVILLMKLLTLKEFFSEDRKNIELILASATAEEKENTLSTEEWKTVCIKWIEEEKWETLYRYSLHCLLYKKDEIKFKRELSFGKKAQSVCIDFVKNDNWTSAESFIKWSSLPKEEIKQLKKEMINSEYGLKTCANLILFDKKVRSMDKFIRWYLPSEEEAKAFRKEFIFSNYGTGTCAGFVNDEPDFLAELISFCVSSEEEVRKLKKRVAYEYGVLICIKFISDNEKIDTWPKRYRFKGGKREEVEKFITWCFSSEEEINDFKKNKLLKEHGELIHFELVKSCRWEEAETFFAWLSLSFEEIKELKKRTLFDHSEAKDMFELLCREEDEIFPDYGSNLKGIELLLRWYLTGKEMALEFVKLFFAHLHEDIHEENVSQNFLMEQLLRDLDAENTGEKTTETLKLDTV